MKVLLVIVPFLLLTACPRPPEGPRTDPENCAALSSLQLLFSSSSALSSSSSQEDFSVALGDRPALDPASVEEVYMPCDTAKFAFFDYRSLEHCIAEALKNGHSVRATKFLRLAVAKGDGPVRSFGETLRLVRLLHLQQDFDAARTLLAELLAQKQELLAMMDSAESLDSRIQSSFEGALDSWSALLAEASDLLHLGVPAARLETLLRDANGQGAPDSVLVFISGAREQAVERDRRRVQWREKEIRKLAGKQADFDGALSILKELQEDYPDFGKDGLYDSLAAYVEKEQWAFQEKNLQKTGEDPAAVWSKADALLLGGRLLTAATEYRKLVYSSYREKALDALNGIARKYCEEQRKSASDLFRRARRKPGKKREKELLSKATGRLKLCLEHFPESPIREKVEKSLLVIEEQLGSVSQ